MAVGNYKVMGLTRRVLWVLIAGAAVLSWTPVWGQEAKTTLVEPPTPLLPHEVGIWVLQPEAAGAPDAAAQDDKVKTVLAEDGLRREEKTMDDRHHGSTRRQFLGSVGLGAGLLIGGAPRLVAATGAAPAVVIGAAILLRPDAPVTTSEA